MARNSIQIDIKQTTYQLIASGMTVPDDILRDLPDDMNVMGNCEVTIHDRFRGPETWKWDSDSETWIDPDGEPYEIEER